MTPPKRTRWIMMRTWSQLSKDRQPLFLNRKRQSPLFSSTGATDTEPTSYVVGYGMTTIQAVDNKPVVAKPSTTESPRLFLARLHLKQAQSKLKKLWGRDSQDQSTLTSTTLNPT